MAVSHRKPFSQAVILGPGLLGASFLQALRQTSPQTRLGAWGRSAAARQQCLEAPWCDFSAPTAAETVAEADLVVVCTPVDTIVPLLAQIAPRLRPGTIVTDVGSTKSLICREARGVLPQGVAFVGSHPMAGSEKTGMEHARADLFEQRHCFVTPLPETDEVATERVVALWKSLGMIVSCTCPEAHDEIVAHISHLPHFLATALCCTLHQRSADWRAYAGGGLRDTSRIAAGDPGLWASIARHNREEILRCLDAFENQLHEFKRYLLNQDDANLRRLLQLGKDYRDGLPER